MLLGSYTWPFLSSYHLAIYHDPYSSAPMAAGLAIDLALAAIFFSAALSLMDRCCSQASFVWAIFLGFSITLALDLGRFCWTVYHGGPGWRATTRVDLLCFISTAVFLLWWLVPRVLEKCTKATRLGLALLGCCIFWMFPMLVYTAVCTRRPALNGFNRLVTATSPRPQRIIWILLDELSYDEVFDHRQPDVKLPHFDELKSQGVVFSNVQPIGDSTERIVPALLLGREIDNIRSSLHRNLYFHDVETSRWEPFNQEASIFADAQRLNWTTGVAGWYNPYCHILSKVLDSCYWQAINPSEIERVTVLRAMGSPLDSLVSRIRAPRSSSDLQLQAHTQEYKDLTAASESLIRDESINFVFIHLPVPHPPGIYNRRTNTLGVRGSYLDNLVLADRTLGDLLSLIQGTKAASRTSIIVSSDHSWRVYLWRSDSSWTREDERVSRGKFDPRPVLMIHLQGNTVGEIRSAPFSELTIHSILSAMLTGEIRSQADLDRWLNEREIKDRQELISRDLSQNAY